ncbi:ricin-type beta-trefoil lectin domain protein [Kitasatospora aburaviensis]
MSMPSYGWITYGPAVPAGPVGQISGYADKCVDVKGGTNANGTPVQIWDCLGNAAQRWKIGTDGTIRALGKCLDVQGGNTGNATRVQVYDCNGTGAQQWQVRADGSILNPQSGRCLDDLGFSTTNGNQLGIWDCNGAANQVWHVPA